MKIYVINGYPQSGKDTFVDFCSEVYAPTFQLWTSTPAKQAAKLLGWSGIKTPEARKALSDLMIVSETAFDGPFRYIRDCLIPLPPNALVFIHCREPRNIKRYIEAFDAESIIIYRGTPSELSCAADRNVCRISYHYAINNFGTLAELRAQAHTFVQTIVKGEGI